METVRAIVLGAEIFTLNLKAALYRIITIFRLYLYLKFN